jgi:hypothetical protein
MFLAKELHKSLEEILEISTLELTMWVAYYNLQGKEQKTRMGR